MICYLEPIDHKFINYYNNAMKSFIALTIFAISSTLSFAQNAAWKLDPVEGSMHNTVGYIYRTYSRGTISYNNVQRKSIAGLEFVCSASDPNKQGPALVIFWDKLSPANTTRDILFEVNKIAKIHKEFIQDGNLLFIPIKGNSDFLVALKQGNYVKFTWEDDISKYMVEFDLKGFNFGEFSTACKINL